ncbi:hypothetical protein Pure05_32860 [Paenarthrobacter ureafaciens]|nr:hypothetical protein Pure01_33680 [Paenarthrobacter ureafaciens]GLU65045.1 hypothetical protein Pure02_32950 [Paenarthrobacter ureafaciens]GLU69523.1 hypothetical protein Pure03_34990 [Paenarthrobacter ureafaciens]GLU73700.1 hypothetical protein Pure04_34150 [Paenarthrobacter ureafaciens]GLU77846.1 hypothetical protein Pure05_32860 [Paenarthrobacter ureafaciens]
MKEQGPSRREGPCFVKHSPVLGLGAGTAPLRANRTHSTSTPHPYPPTAPTPRRHRTPTRQPHPLHVDTAPLRADRTRSRGAWGG